MAEQVIMKQQISYLIIPFAYCDSLADTQGYMDSGWFASAKTENRNYFFDHIDALVKKEDGSNKSIGYKYNFKTKSRPEIGLPEHTNASFELRTKRQTIAIVAIKDIDLYLFESGVGFLTLKITMPSGSAMDQVIEANYYLKRLNRRDILLTHQHGMLDTDIITLHMSDLVERLIQPLKVKTYFEADGEKHKPTRALSFSLSITDSPIEDSQDKGEYLYRLRRSFKYSYLPDSADLRMDNNPEVLSLFSNSYWGMALEGAVSLVELAREEGAGTTTDTFFQSNYVHSFETTYLYMYILALHQRYGLLHLTIEMSELSRKYDELTSRPIEQMKDVSAMHRRIVAFKLRSTFSQVSNVTHQESLYTRFREVLKIDDLLHGLHSEMETLSSLMEISAARERMKREAADKQKSERFQTAIAVVSLLFLPLGAATGFFGMNFSFIGRFSAIDFIAGLCVLYLVCFLGYRYFVHAKQQSDASGDEDY